MKSFPVILGWVLAICGLVFGMIHFWYGAKKYRTEGRHEFNVKDFLLGRSTKSFTEKPSLQFFVEGLMGILAAYLIYVILLVQK